MSTSPVLVGAGDIAHCDKQNDEATAALLDSIPGTVFTAGDNAYPDGAPADFANCYDPSWGRHKARTQPAPGNHDYTTPGAAGYFGYFGPAAGDTSRGYYSYDLGTWHVVVMNNYEVMGVGSAQEQWLRADLAAHPAQCILGVWHEPLFSSTMSHGLGTQPLWQALHEAGAEVVVTGHDHNYERFAPQTAAGTADPTTGIREFIVGTGGAGLMASGTPAPNSEVRNATTHGVLKLTLRESDYEWKFVPVAGRTFSDSGSAPCHGLPSNQPPRAAFTVSCTGLTCSFVEGSSDPDGTVIAWRWTFGDGDTSTVRNPSHTYAAAGSYIVRLTVTDDKGSTGGVRQRITVTTTTSNQPPVAAFTASCTNLSCDFTDASTDPDGPVVAWSWSFGDGGTASTQSPSRTYATAGTYTVQVTVTDDQGSTGTTSKSVTVTAPNQPPVANPGGPYRSEDLVSFDGSRSFDPDNNTPLSYAWDFGDGATGTGVRPTHTYTADRTYMVTLTVTDAQGARGAPAQTTATIGNLPPTVNAGPDVTMAPGLYTLRASFSDPGANDAPWTYTISWGDGLSESGTTSSQSSSITATHPYVLPQQHTVRVTVTDKDGGTGSDELVVTVALP